MMTEICSCAPFRKFLAYDTSTALPHMFFVPTGMSHLEKEPLEVYMKPFFIGASRDIWEFNKKTLLLQKLGECLMIFQMFCCLSPQLIQCSHSVPILLLMPVAFLKCDIIILRVKLHILLAAVQDDRRWLFSDLHVLHKHFRLY